MEKQKINQVKRKINRKKVGYPACFYEEKEGGYSVIFPDLNHLATQGNDLKEARNMAVECLDAYLEGAFDDDVILPDPTTDLDSIDVNSEYDEYLTAHVEMVYSNEYRGISLIELRNDIEDYKYEESLSDDDRIKRLNDMVRILKWTKADLIYVCSPYSGDVKHNVAVAKSACRYVYEQNKIPIAPHLLYPQFMDDNNDKERQDAIYMGLMLLYKCDEMWVFGEKASEGMRIEIAAAKSNGIKIRLLTPKGSTADISELEKLIGDEDEDTGEENENDDA